MPAPDGDPDLDSAGACSGRSPRCTGGGDTDWTLSALQIAAASLTGPMTWLLVGIAPGRTSLRGWRSRISPRFRALASRAVSDGSPNVYSNGPRWRTRGRARLDTTIAGTRKPSCL